MSLGLTTAKNEKVDSLHVYRVEAVGPSISNFIFKLQFLYVKFRKISLKQWYFVKKWFWSSNVKRSFEHIWHIQLWLFAAHYISVLLNQF